MKFYFRIIGGEVKYDIASHRTSYLNKQKDGAYVEEIKKVRDSVSAKQYRYYYSVIVAFWSEEMGSSPTGTDLTLKCEFARYKGWINAKGMIQVPSKSADFDTAIEEEFHTWCRKTFHDLYGGNIPKPNEPDYDY